MDRAKDWLSRNFAGVLVAGWGLIGFVAVSVLWR